ncbi:hypothetical protein FOG50_00805 [Hanseniaspora uvarum]|nr:hypothetical protein FOG48_00059 [Hanseniaspora uvarum]KAF0278322.1 hypothetical protein FOG50_00805 [Hanseniaspora uvarum]
MLNRSLLNREVFNISKPSLLTTKLYKSLDFKPKVIDTTYQEKLLKKAKERGFNTIEELKESLKEELEKKKKDFNQVDPLNTLKKYQEAQSKEIEEDMNKPTTKSLGAIPENKEKKPFKTLSSYVDKEKFMELSPQEIEFLWRARFSTTKMAENHLHAVLQKNIWTKMFDNAKENPVFVLPLPRDITPEQNTDLKTGAELFYVQWSFPDKFNTHCIITSLVEYQLHKEFAKPYLTISFFGDMLERKNISLMVGQLDQDSSINMNDCTLLLLNLQRFYGVIEGGLVNERLAMLRAFNKGDTSFDVNKLVDLANSMT